MNLTLEERYALFCMIIAVDLWFFGFEISQVGALLNNQLTHPTYLTGSR